MSAPAAAEAAAAGSRAADAVLEVSGVTLRFGGLTSLDDVALEQRRGEILAVIGPNGAGKTSLFNCLTGVYRPQEGRITFRPREGEPISVLGKAPWRVNRMGIARTFQNIRLFDALTAVENVKIGAESMQHTGAVGAVLGLRRARREERESDKTAFDLLEFVGLASRANDLASAMPYGDQRRLEIARAMATGPEVLLLDEPAAGTNPAEKLQLEELIRRVAGTGVSVLLIEHDMRLVMSVAARVVVLNFGKVIAAGRPDQVRTDPAVVEAYLGAGDDDGPSAALAGEEDGDAARA